MINEMPIFNIIFLKTTKKQHLYTFVTQLLICGKVTAPYKSV